ncbi:MULTISPECIES: RnfH family protein [Reinekea]|jgi:putative ubiquitin-RnfH superfamily antitoxin RatB of RatAB toxin-antitoxin module|uniref:RnfH family protein n=1 Tax=Reinekea TaxID=230494 RepID=UPI0023569209|nr:MULTISPECIES: RnfH family protein [Reinekea]
MIEIEVAYATPEQQLVLALSVPEHTDLRSAVLLSGIAKTFPGLNVSIAPLGLFGRKVAQPEAQLVAAGDRIEIYRPLTIDPKQARLNRAAKTKGEKAQSPKG